MVIYIDTWRCFIWTWLSCGGAQSRGAPCGKAHHRTVWITFVAPMMFRGRSTSLHGQLGGKCGQIRWRLSTRGFRRICCCLATSTCPWCTTTESTSEVFRILLTGGSICHCYTLCFPLPAVPPAVGVISPDSSSSGSLCPAGSPEVMDRSPRTTRRAFRCRRPVRVLEPPVENIPVLMIQNPLAAAGAVVLDCRPPLLSVSMDISDRDLSAIRVPAMLADVDVLPL